MFYDELRWKENAMLQILNDKGEGLLPEAIVMGVQHQIDKHLLDVLIARSMCIFASSVINY